MTDLELDEIITFRWPVVMRCVMRFGSEREQGFVKSIARFGKRPTWRPSFKQAAWMRSLVAEHCSLASEEIKLIERWRRRRKAHAGTWASADVVRSRVSDAHPHKAQQMVTGQAQSGKTKRS